MVNGKFETVRTKIDSFTFKSSHLFLSVIRTPNSLLKISYLIDAMTETCQQCQAGKEKGNNLQHPSFHLFTPSRPANVHLLSRHHTE